ncbi:hypothetical protein DFJ58DRAFT_845934 [Suillus subalutaceus]|uniref:uncharacterized protein n=1 Tax=Suillus subalutaceus TaxID=48586 RepID=UPI001B870FD9|nr:uncharacterized protein DFJ58DRAFT_845934 [Suillus subalutaceus]KAG1838818.1 hypothetical protein DFJ58DRAFT_845934 [Suillus subalutaceus]
MRERTKADNDNHWKHKVRPSGDYYFRVKPNSEGSTAKGSNNDGVCCNACYKPQGKGYDVPMRWVDIEGRSWMHGNKVQNVPICAWVSPREYSYNTKTSHSTEDKLCIVRNVQAFKLGDKCDVFVTTVSMIEFNALHKSYNKET